MYLVAVVFAVAAKARHWPDPPPSWMHNATVACVRWRESTDGRASRNVYQLEDQTWRSLGGQGWAGDASRAEQDYRAYLLWMRSGCHQPWGQYDGCC